MLQKTNGFYKSQIMNKKIILAVIIIILFGIAGYCFFFKNQTGTTDKALSTTTPQTQSATTSIKQRNQNTSAAVQQELSVQPMLLPSNDEWSNANQVLNPEFVAIKKAALEIIRSNNPADDIENYVHYSLTAVGHRYVLMTYYPPTTLHPRDTVVDMVNKTAREIMGGPRVQLKNGIISFSSTDASYYKPDSPSYVPLPGSKLSPGETYFPADNDIMTGPNITAQTDMAVTLAVYSDPKWLDDPNNPTQKILDQKKLREVTLTLP